MIKPVQISNIRDMTVGQLYMYVDYGKMQAGVCKSLEAENKATLQRDTNGYKSMDTVDLDSKYTKTKIYQYNSIILNRYNTLLEKQKLERDQVLSGEPIPVNISFRMIEPIKKETWLDKVKKLWQNYHVK